MAKVKFNVKGVEVRRGGGEPLPKGVYLCDIESCAVTKPQSKDERIEVVYTVADGDHKGRKLWDYINLESEAAAFKVREFLEAVGIVTGKKEAGEFDPAKLVGEQVNVRVIHQPDNRPEHEGEMQQRVGGVTPVDGEEEDENLDDESGEEEDDAVDLDELDRAELKKLIKEQELGITVKRAWSDDELREAITEVLGEGDDEPESDDEESDDEESGDDENEVDLDELDRSELKQLIKDQELEITVKRSHSDDDLRKLITEALGGDDGPDYEAMSIEDLKNTCKERGLKTTGSKKILITRLEKDDEARDEEEPF